MFTAQRNFPFLITLVLAVGCILPTTQAADDLEIDWLFQADNKPTLARIGQEIQWAREMAARISSADQAPDLSQLLAALKKCEQKMAAIAPNAGRDAAKELYFTVRRIKRQIMFSDPLVDFDQVLLVDNPYPMYPRRGKEWQAATLEWGHEARHRNGYMAAPGGRLLVLEGLNPGDPIRDISPDGEGSFWRPDLSFDGQKVVFSYQPEEDLSFHLYEVNIDGSGMRQLTVGDYDDMDPIYLPDGNIMFSTSRANTYIRCMPMTTSFVLARCDKDGKNIYIISRNNEPDSMPSILNDGRIIYTRWEYTDKPLWRVQSLWSCNPDGTGVASFWGNQSVWPDVLTEARAIPGSERIMFNGVGHHAWFDGCIGIIDPAEGVNYPKGITKVTADIPWVECGNGPNDVPEKENYHASGKFYAYKSPWPLSEEVFLVSARHGNRLYNEPGDNGWNFRLYLMDVYGNRELIYKGEHNAMYAMPVKPRPKPRQMPDRVKWPKIADGEKVEDGILYSNNVFQDAPDIPRDKVKYMRIIKMVPKTYTTWFKSVQHDGPSVGAFQAESVKSILGTVPVEEDGSVCFKLPPGDAVYFQLLDENYQCIKNMRSFTGVMPGEVRGCTGCHEMGSNAPMNTMANSMSIAAAKGAVDITPPPWGNETISFERFAQPVFDQYCADCHQGEGKAVDKLDLTLRDGGPGFKSIISSIRVRPNERTPFKEPYLTLVGGTIPWGRAKELNECGVVDNLAGVLVVEGYGANDPLGLETIPAMAILSPSSKIVQNALTGKHHDVKVPMKDLRRLIAWVDSNGPYLGMEEIRDMYDPIFRGVDKMQVRPRVATAPMIERFNVRQDGDSWAIAGEPKIWDGTILIRDWPEGAVPKIIKAHYGTERDNIEVTDILNKCKLDGPVITLEKDGQTMNGYNQAFTDPVPGTVKQLFIEYEVNGAKEKIKLNENEMIILRTPKALVNQT